MIKIMKVLVDYGMNFNYENYGSGGETITCFELGFDFYNQQGELTLSYEGENDTYEECDKGYDYFARRVEDIAIEETASF